MNFRGQIYHGGKGQGKFVLGISVGAAAAANKFIRAFRRSYKIFQVALIERIVAIDYFPWLVHYSTDYVFDGTGQDAWLESDRTASLNAYGLTKLEGERFIAAACSKHLIFRTSWVYAARGHNFAKTMLRLAQEKDRLTVIADQIGAPTGAELLADVTAHALRAALSEPRLAGLYHLAAAGETSWHGYASHVIEFARKAGLTLSLSFCNLIPITTSDYLLPATRPLNSRLNTQKLEAAFGLAMPCWQQGVEHMLTEVLGL